MPTYEYRCAKCGDDLEVYQTFSEKPLTRHKGCGGKLAKVLSPAGIVLKGSGFYKTDNRSSGKRSSDSERQLGVVGQGLRQQDSDSNGIDESDIEVGLEARKSESKSARATRSRRARRRPTPRSPRRRAPRVA